MTSALNKRQQARNERALQDLIKSIPGNDRCADCGARNPGWASWSLGIFLCMRCATLHRKLGTHISKVKSLSMDSWSNDQVESMKRTGNVASNLLYNPGNVKPNIPIDVDEVDGAMERFLRQKYEHKSLGESRPTTRQNTGSTSSIEDRPPPLPPKPGNRFGFGLRASSSTFPTSRSDPVSPPRSPGLHFNNSSPPRVNKASRVFGHNIGSASADSFEAKLSALRDMGFPDERRNATVLKGLNGNVEKSVETLIRLGEGARSPSGVQTPASTQSDNVNGLSIGRTRPSTTQSSNPFDRLDMVPPSSQHLAPLQTQATGVSQASYASAPNSYNPFLPATRPPQSAHSSLEQPFQNMGLGQAQAQPPQLFPNHTGGHGSQNQQQSYNPFLQTFTPPPVPQIPSQYAVPQQSTSPYVQTNGTPSSQGHGANPFLNVSAAPPNNPFNGQPNNLAPFGQPTQQPQQFSPQTNFPQQQQQQQMMSMGASQQPQGYNPNAGQMYQQQADFSTPQPAYQQYQVPQNPYQPQAQFPVRRDKSSILALYGQPQLAPAPPAAMMPGDGGMPNGQARRSATMPVMTSGGPEVGAAQAGSHNPFAQSVGPQAPGPVGGTRHVSQESVDFSGMMGGRQSPDAFAGLSARFGR
ncbi:GTPase activating protein for Arf [Phyllosticta citribraziliensis]|uniref:GTPase activating protein for Arf n=1 Tax=Phyllosticta citribraziliensis TaxID=989973 RepID=A0ABR1M7M9_9PEZI